MSDWPPVNLEVMPTIHTYSNLSIGPTLVAAGGTAMGNVSGAVYPTANLALFIPFYVPRPITVTKLWAKNGAAVSGNIDMGIYDVAGTRIVSIGSTAQAGTSTFQEYDITDTLLGAGEFYIAVALDNATGTLLAGVLAVNILPCILGMAQMAAAFPLPATATLAQITGNYIPMIGMSVSPRTVV